MWQIKEWKAPGQRYHDCGGPGALFSSFCQVRPQRNDEKKLRWSVGIEPPLKARLNTLSLALPWALWYCFCCTHVIFNRVEPPLKARWNTRGTLWSARERASVALSSEQERRAKCVSLCLKAIWNTFSVCFACSAERAIKAISLALHSVSHRLKAMCHIHVRRTNLFFGLK